MDAPGGNESQSGTTPPAVVTSGIGGNKFGCTSGAVGSNRSGQYTLKRHDLAKIRNRWTSFSMQDSFCAAGLGASARQLDDLIFDMFKDAKEQVSVAKFLAVLRNMGLKKNDPRLHITLENFQRVQKERADKQNAQLDPFHLVLDRETFKRCIIDNIVLISRAMQNNFVIPDWVDFCRHIEEIYENCKPNMDGQVGVFVCDRSDGENQVATYIPQLARLHPEKWGVAICTVDGQRAAWGDCKEPFCLQSVSKPVVYGIALNDLSSEVVHQYIGQEPSGRLFNDICLDHNKKPHNPMINAGAIIVSSLVKQDLTLADRFDYVFGVCKKLVGGEYVGFNNPTFLSERATADRNFALAYYMREHKCFPPGSNLKETLDLYFQFCSLEVTCESLSVLAATLANGGICPITGEAILSNRSVRDVLSLMYSCGMYDYSGQFAFHVGLPAKSGVSGCMIIVVPNVIGFALWSPPLDKLGNTVRGVQFSTELVERFNFHNYDSLVNSDSKKIDPRRKLVERQGQRVVAVLFAAASGDLGQLKRYWLQDVNIVRLSDYDGRTALHLAASEGHTHIVKFLIETCRVPATTTDRWGRTPLDDAKHFHHKECIDLLANYSTKANVDHVESLAQRLSDAVLRESEEMFQAEDDSIDNDDRQSSPLRSPDSLSTSSATSSTGVAGVVQSSGQRKRAAGLGTDGVQNRLEEEVVRQDSLEVPENANPPEHAVSYGQSD